MPSLNFYQALAISLVLGLFVNSSEQGHDRKRNLENWEKIVNAIVPFARYFFALIAGAWLKLYI